MVFKVKVSEEMGCFLKKKLARPTLLLLVVVSKAHQSELE